MLFQPWRVTCIVFSGVVSVGCFSVRSGGTSGSGGGGASMSSGEATSAVASSTATGAGGSGGASISSGTSSTSTGMGGSGSTASGMGGASTTSSASTSSMSSSSSTSSTAASTSSGGGNACAGAPDGSPCQDTDLGIVLQGVCSSGHCIPGCWVNGQLYPDKTYFLDAEVCLSCSPSVSTTSLYTGNCHWAGVIGKCSGDGVCVLNTAPCSSGCVYCTDQPCGNAHCRGLPDPNGTCTDGNPCTTDVCDTHYGACDSSPVADGTSCGGGKTCTQGVCH